MDEPVATPSAAPPAAPPIEQASVEPAPSRWRWPLRLAGITVVAGLFALLVWATLHAGRGESFVSRIAVGDRPPAPEFDLAVLWPRTETWPPPLRRALTNGRLDLRELRGRRVVMNFWASWCIPCRDEAPLLNASARAHRGQVVFVGVNVQDLEEDALKFLREFDAPYVSIRDGGNTTYGDYGLTGVPETFYIDADGQTVAHVPGAVSKETLERGVEQLIRGGAK